MNPYPNLVLKSGDYLNYTMTGVNESGAFEGTAQSHTVELNLTSWPSMHWSGSFNLTPSIVKWPTSWDEMLNGLRASSAAIIYGTGTVQTAFGEKHVDKYVRWSDGFLLIGFVGQSSGVGYRLVAANSNTTMELDLQSTIISGIEGLDKVFVHRERSAHSSDAESWEHGTKITQGGFQQCAMLDLSKDATYKYRLYGNGSRFASFYLFSLSNITQMEEGNSFAFERSVAVPGEDMMLMMLGPGKTFWVFDTTQASGSEVILYQSLKYI